LPTIVQICTGSCQQWDPDVLLAALANGIWHNGLVVSLQLNICHCTRALSLRCHRAVLIISTRICPSACSFDHSACFLALREAKVSQASFEVYDTVPAGLATFLAMCRIEQ